MSFWSFRNEKNGKAPNKNILRGSKQALSTDICIKLNAFPLFFTVHVYFIMYILFVIYTFFLP